MSAPSLVEPQAAPAAAPAAAVTGLRQRYGAHVALDGVSFEVPDGAVFGIVGSNGAGKSTTLAVLATLLRPTAGTASVCGHDCRTQARRVRRVMGYVPDQLGLYDAMDVSEYLGFFAGAYRVKRRERADLIDGLLELVDLTAKRHAQVDTLSRGMKQRLSLARALLHDPRVLLLDEPASGLDPRARDELTELLRGLRDLGKTTVITTHILPELAEVCTDLVVLDAGRLLAGGTPASLAERLDATRRVTVELAGGEERTYHVADDAEREALLRRLVVDDALRVVDFRTDPLDLEELYRSLTEVHRTEEAL